MQSERCNQFKYLVVFGVLIALVAGAGVAGAATLTVPAGYATIPAAVAVAAPGDVIIVSPGTYTDTVDFGGKNIAIQSTDPTNADVVAATIITVSGAPAVVFQGTETPAARLAGFTIKSSGITLTAPTKSTKVPFTAAILVGAASPTIQNNVLTLAPSTAISVLGGSPLIDHNVFSYNRGYNGSCLYVGSPAPPPPGAAKSIVGPTVGYNTFVGNVASMGGCIYVDAAAGATISHNQFGVAADGQVPAPVSAALARMQAGGQVTSASNTTPKFAPAQRGNRKSLQAHKGQAAPRTLAAIKQALPEYGGNTAGSGGVIYCNNGTLELNDNTFTNNNADDGACLYCLAASTVTSTNDTFTNDWTTDYNYGGGVVWADTSAVTFNNGSFRNCIGYNGGVAYLGTGCALAFNGCSFGYCVSYEDGGIVYAYEGGSLSFSECSEAKCAANYGAVFYAEGSNTGTAITLANSTFASNATPYERYAIGYTYGDSLTATNCQFTDNQSCDALLYIDCALANITGCTFADNTSVVDGDGPIVYYYDGTGVGTSTIANNRFLRNSSYYGVLYFDQGDIDVTGNAFQRNTAMYGAGAIYWTSSAAARVSNNTFLGNSSPTGGAIYCDASIAPLDAPAGSKATKSVGLPQISGNFFRGNMAQSGSNIAYGGALYLSSDLTVNNNIFLNNSSSSEGGAVYSSAAGAQLYNNSFCGNYAPQGGQVYLDEGGSSSFKNNIVAFGRQGGGIYAATVGANYTHNDVYGNEGGDWTPAALPIAAKDVSGNGNISVNPLFADRVTGDLHLKSIGGRWDPATSSWVKDTYTSRCIDAGDPEFAFSQETAANGGRVNMGAYGNTAQASKSSMFAQISFTPGVDGLSRTGNHVFVFMWPVVHESVLDHMVLGAPVGTASQKTPAPTARNLEWASNVKLVLKPDTSALDANTDYALQFTAGIRRQNATNILYGETFNFHTGTEPVVTSVTPADGATAVDAATTIAVAFDQAMNKRVVQQGFRIDEADLPGTFTWAADGKSFIFTPTAPLALNTEYNITIGRGCRALSGESLVRPYHFTFNTGSPAPSSGPVVAAAVSTGAGAQITVRLTSAATVGTVIRNLAGVEIARLAPQQMAAGVNTLLWNGKSKSGTNVPSGRYFIQVTAAQADGTQSSCLLAVQK